MPNGYSDREEALAALKSADELHKVRSGLSAAADDARGADLGKALEGPRKSSHSDVLRARIHEQIAAVFTTHDVAPEALPSMEAILNKGRELATLMADVVPVGRELSAALLDLEHAVTTARAGIARTRSVKRPPIARATVVVNGHDYLAAGHTVADLVASAYQQAQIRIDDPHWHNRGMQIHRLADIEGCDATLVDLVAMAVMGATYSVSLPAGSGG
jgi:hypothetical protein